MGYIIFCIPIWEFFHSVFKIPVTSAWLIISTISLTASIGLILVFYKLCSILADKKIAFIASLFLIFSPGIIIYSGACMTEMLATFFLYGGLLVYYYAIEKDNLSLFLISGAIAGFGIAVKEQVLFFTPLFIYLTFLNKKTNKKIIWFWVVYIMFPVIGEIVSHFGYLDFASTVVLPWFSGISIKSTLKRAVSIAYQLNIYYTIIPLILATLGGLMILIRKKYKDILLITCWLIIPIFPLLIMHPIAIRYYIFSFPALAYLSASFIIKLSKWKIVLIVALIINFTGFSFIRQPAHFSAFTYRKPPKGIIHFVHLLRTHNKELLYEKKYGKALYENFAENSVFLTGTYVFLTYLYYQQTGLRPNWATVFPWMGNNEIITKTKYYLQLNRPVFIDTELVTLALNEGNHDFLNKFKDNFSLEKVILPNRKEINTLYQVFLKK
ncbi:MAG: glycosyltransferase family 39 protein [bacterium]|nr:glycosyltransferase family 39 protein [bacterium]